MHALLPKPWLCFILGAQQFTHMLLMKASSLVTQAPASSPKPFPTTTQSIMLLLYCDKSSKLAICPLNHCYMHDTVPSWCHGTEHDAISRSLELTIMYKWNFMCIKQQFTASSILAWATTFLLCKCDYFRYLQSTAMHYLSFHEWLISLSIKSSRSTFVIIYDKILFCLNTE